MSEEKQRLRRELRAKEVIFDRGIYKHQRAIARLASLKRAEQIKARDMGIIGAEEVET